MISGQQIIERYKSIERYNSLDIKPFEEKILIKRIRMVLKAEKINHREGTLKSLTDEKMMLELFIYLNHPVQIIRI